MPREITVSVTSEVGGETYSRKVVVDADNESEALAAFRRLIRADYINRLHYEIAAGRAMCAVPDDIRADCKRRFPNAA